MALGKNKEAVKTAGGAFEDEGGTTVADAPKQSTPSPAQEAAAGTEASTAITKAAGTAVAKAGTFGDVFKDFQDQITDLEFGTVARLVGSNGRIVAKKDSKSLVLGPEIKVTLVSFNDTYQVSPGDDTAEAKKAVRYSRDGVTIDGPVGGDVKAYVEKLRTTDGFAKASVKKYTSLVCILNEAAGAAPDAQGTIGEMVEVSLSPTAGQAFKGHRMQTSVKSSRGLLPPGYDVTALVIRADVRKNGSNEYTALAVTDK